MAELDVSGRNDSWFGWPAHRSAGPSAASDLPFERPSQLVAFAGLDPKIFQSGQYDAPGKLVSRRGSPYLRRTLC